MNVTREVLSAASKVNAIVDHVNSSIFLKNISIYQRRGYMATSLTEIKNKSDIIIVFSNNLFETYPRLMDKFLATKNSFSVNSKKKEIYVIGKKVNNTKDCNIRDKRITYFLILILLSLIPYPLSLIPYPSYPLIPCNLCRRPPG